MGHDEQRSAARGEVLGQPADGLDVEVVRRLVEHEQLGAVEQEVGDRDPPPFATGQDGDLGVHPVREAAQLDAAEQPVEHVAEAAVGGPLVVGARADERGADRRVPVELVALVQQAEVDVAPARDEPGVGRLDRPR